ncbi:MAG: SHOCT domain-containing protein, partial [Bacteroidales bacterium]|nr:SHOCT domain-containing protein [Bacteroidales bacterium]
MASNRIYTESVITLNGEQAQRELREMAQKAKAVADRLMEVHEAKGPDSAEFKKLNKELDKMIQQQKDLNESTKRVQKTLSDLNGATINQLEATLRKLQKQLRNTKPNTQEWRAYSSEIKAVRARMAELDGQARESQKLLGGFFKKIGWTALVAGAIAAIKKFGTDMIAQTQLIGDRWKYETAAWKSAYGSFIADISSGKGWNELIANMAKAYDTGKEVAKMLDELFERNNSLAITEAELNLQAEQQRKIMMDSTKSTKERIDAAEEYDNLQLEIAQNRKDVAQQELDAMEKQLHRRTKMSKTEYKYFIDNYNANLDIIRQATEYTDTIDENEKAIKRLQRSYNMMDSAAQAAAADILSQIAALKAENLALEQSTDKATKDIAGLVKKYKLGNDEMVKAYADAKVKTVNADVNYEKATQKSNRQAANLRKQMAQEAKQTQDKAFQDEIKASEARFKEIQNQAKQAYLDGQISEQEYQNRLSVIQENSLRDRLAIIEKYKRSTIDIQAQLLDLSMKDKKKLEQAFAETEAAAAAAVDDFVKETEKDMAELMAELDSDMEEFNKHWAEMLQKAQDIHRELSPAVALRDDMNEELSALDELHDASLISEEEYQAKRLEIIR